MESDKRDGFAKAYAWLRGSIATGGFKPGQQLIISDIAQEIRLSATPVREALSRLAGEGLIESLDKGGYAVPLPSASRLLEMLALQELFLVAALSEELERQADERSLTRAVSLPISEPQTLPASAGELATTLFAAILGLSENRLLVDAGLAAVGKLSSARQVEPVIFFENTELDEMVLLLRAGALLELEGAITRYHHRRRDAVTRLERALQLSANVAKR
jgi:DNA-binding transcriptional regulator YhcF (GntR family)